jgi:hypothetical protein
MKGLSHAPDSIHVGLFPPFQRGEAIAVEKALDPFSIRQSYGLAVRPAWITNFITL